VIGLQRSSRCHCRGAAPCAALWSTDMMPVPQIDGRTFTVFYTVYTAVEIQYF